MVRLCDGSTVYILGPFLDDLEGSHLVVSTITVTSANQAFNVTAVQPEPIFAMAFNHEANGNISQAVRPASGRIKIPDYFSSFTIL